VPGWWLSSLNPWFISGCGCRRVSNPWYGSGAIGDLDVARRPTAASASVHRPQGNKRTASNSARNSTQVPNCSRVSSFGFKMFDKIPTVQPGAIVDSKRLSAVLEQIKRQLAAYPARRQRGHVCTAAARRTNSRRRVCRRRGRRHGTVLRQLRLEAADPEGGLSPPNCGAAPLWSQQFA
jgi:hypothetical protein